MTDRESRERLIELIQNAVGGCARHWAEIIADHIFADGWIRPPCKAGDKVYRIAKNGKTITEEQIGNVNVEFTVDNGTGIQGIWWLKDYNIGVTTFLTKEEAEKVLAERSEQ